MGEKSNQTKPNNSKTQHQKKKRQDKFVCFKVDIFCVTAITVLHIAYLQFTLQSRNRNIHMHKFFPEQGLNQKQIHIHKTRIFFSPFPVGSTKPYFSFLQYILIWLLSFSWYLE